MVRVGIIGAGHFASVHLAALAKIGTPCALEAVARRSLGARFAEAESLGAETVSAEALVEHPKLDAVIVCCPNDLHAFYTLAALRNGKHVFCEKPMAMTLADAWAMLQAADEAGKVLHIGHITRHYAPYTAVARLLARGDLGKPLAASAVRLQARAGHSWRMDLKRGGGAPLDLLIHDFDLVCWYCGKPERVFAHGRRHPLGAYEYLQSVVTFEDETTATVDGGFLLPSGAALEAQVRVVCEEGCVEAGTRSSPAGVRVLRSGGQEEWLPHVFSGQRDVAMVSQLRAFVDAIRTNNLDRSQVEAGMQALQCAVAAVNSATTGLPVDLADGGV